MRASLRDRSARAAEHRARPFHATTFNVESGNNDEYVGTLTIGTAGTLAYAYRFSFDGGASVTYCDTNGAGSNAGLTFEPGMLGSISVH